MLSKSALKQYLNIKRLDIQREEEKAVSSLGQELLGEIKAKILPRIKFPSADLIKRAFEFQQSRFGNIEKLFDDTNKLYRLHKTDRKMVSLHSRLARIYSLLRVFAVIEENVENTFSAIYFKSFFRSNHFTLLLDAAGKIWRSNASQDEKMPIYRYYFRQKEEDLPAHYYFLNAFEVDDIDGIQRKIELALDVNPKQIEKDLKVLEKLSSDYFEGLINQPSS